MNCAEFKDIVSHMDPTGTIIASWSLTQEVTGWSLLTINIFLIEFSENI